MHFVAPSSQDLERFYLRMLLLYRKGCQGYTDLRTIDGTEHSTFQQACKALGLIDDDAEWDQILNTAQQSTTNVQHLRNLFTLILLNCTPTNPNDLWQKYKKALSADILYAKRLQFRNENLDYTQEIYDRALYEIDTLLNKNGRALSNFHSMPTYHIDQETLERHKTT